LVELLTVIAVISILMALLFPAIGIVRESARKAQARSDLMQLVAATKQYYTEYGFYPMNDRQKGANWDTCYGDPDGLYSSADLCDILRGIADTGFNSENQLNPRRIVFFEGKNVSNAESPRAGFATKDIQGSSGKIKKGAFVDPWGNEYVVFIDGDYDNQLDTALSWFYWGQTPAPALRAGVGGTSLGKDCSWGTNGNGKFTGSDDIVTWQ
jgi:type II secretory pathway pseudopilin PulG